MQELGPAGYMKDQYDYPGYLLYSSFLSWFNNEKDFDANIILKYTNLKNFVQVQFNLDEIVIPYQSEWFGYYAINSDEIQLYQDTPDYQLNLLGLRTNDLFGKKY